MFIDFFLPFINNLSSYKKVCLFRLAILFRVNINKTSV